MKIKEEATRDGKESNSVEHEIEIIPCPIHPALVRPILLAGADRTLVLMNMTFVTLLIFGVGLHWVTLLMALSFGLVGHGILIRLAKYDPLFSKIYLRHIRYHDYYTPQGSLLSKPGRPLS